MSDSVSALLLISVNKRLCSYRCDGSFFTQLIAIHRDSHAGENLYYLKNIRVACTSHGRGVMSDQCEVHG